MSIYDAAKEYQKNDIDTVIIAGKNMELDLREIGRLREQDY